MFDIAFAAWGTEVTWLEALAFSLALSCVVLNVFEVHWGWPLAIVSAALYGVLFHASRLYAEAWLQAFFIAASAWGWWQWLFAARTGDGGAAAPLAVARLQRRHLAWLAGLWLAGWLALGALLSRMTDSDVPWLDAFPTVGSLIGQVLLGRKFLENWWVWIVVNAVSVALLSVKGLWLSALLYLVFFGLSVAGLRQWRRRCDAAPPAERTQGTPGTQA